MEVMFAWFPLLKAVIGVILMFTLYYLFKHGWHKVGMALLILLIGFMMLNPIGYDGTNSIEASRENIRLVDDKVQLAHEEHPIAVKSPEKTFDEQMAIQEAASDARTAKLRKELGLN